MKIDYEGLKKAFYFNNDPNKRWKSVRVGLMIIIFISVCFVGMMYLFDKEEGEIIISWISDQRIYVIGVFIVIVLMMMATASGNADKDKKKIKDYNDIITNYSSKADPILDSVENVYETTIFRYTRRNELFKVYRPFFYWIEDKRITLFEKPPKDIVHSLNLNPFFISLEQIKYFEVIGEKFYENKISGGGSQEGDLSKAIAGQALFGTAGAVVGGQQKIDPIKSELILHDNRETRIVMNPGEDGISEIIVRFDFFQMLKDMLPQKDKSIVDEIIKQNLINKQTNVVSDKVTDKLKLLEELLHDGVIDDEEYHQRKAKLLDEALK